MKRWKVISLAALAERDEGWRKEGEPLWPERFGIEDLTEIQKSDPVVWECSYQQRPTVGGGAWFDTKWLQYYKTVDPKTMNVYIAVDPALAKTKRSDFTAIFVFGVGQDRNYYWLQMVRDRIDPAERAARIFALHRKWRPLHVGYEEYGLQSDIVYLRDKMERENYRFPLLELGRSGTWHNLSKSDRIRTLVPLGRTGRLWLPNPQHRHDDSSILEHVEYFIEREWGRYPGTEYDDSLDVMSRINDPDMRVIFPMVMEKKDRFYESARSGTTWMSA